MQSPFDNIVQHLFHQPSLLSVTVSELERMAEQHPYFAAAHFLLLKKMQDTSHPQFSTQLHKTTLYFNNPLWLQFLLQPERVRNFTVLDKAPFISNETAPEEPAASIETETPATETYNYAEATTVPAETDSQNSIMDVITEVFEELPAPAVITEQAAEFAAPEETSAAPAQAATAAPEDEAATALALQQLYDSADNTRIPVAAPQPSPEMAEEAITAIALQELYDVTNVSTEPAAETVTNPEITEAEITALALQELYDTTVAAAAPGAAKETATPAGEEPLQPAEIETVSALPDQKPLLRIIETPAAGQDMLFEPYHTVDYFASQGIKLSKTETDAKDQLGRKLRSFTDWLKTMKKLPQASVETILSKNDESKVVADAIHSIENKEVITEAMAEVFEKQGMAEKAAEVYQKLSLLNPAKSAYFAAKIEELKQ